MSRATRDWNESHGDWPQGTRMPDVDTCAGCDRYPCRCEADEESARGMSKLASEQ